MYPTLDTADDNGKVAPDLFDDVYTSSYPGHATACIGASFHPKRVAILAIEGPYPDAMIANVDKEMSKIHAKVVATERYSFTATDITAQVQHLLAAKPNVVFLFAYFGAVNDGTTSFPKSRSHPHTDRGR